MQRNSDNSEDEKQRKYGFCEDDSERIFCNVQVKSYLFSFMTYTSKLYTNNYFYVFCNIYFVTVYV